MILCTIAKDKSTGESKGFFIEMESADEEQKVIEAPNKKKLKGSRIRVKAAD